MLLPARVWLRRTQAPFRVYNCALRKSKGYLIILFFLIFSHYF
ncbi:hypothetical protein HMPREF3189_01124 [Clostridiales bacterium KA00134]|nr:hypothetical protein HMPREF3189_01124 [Clostridiales bacterium KA00134]